MNWNRIKHIVLIVAGLGIPIVTAVSSALPTESKVAIGFGTVAAILASLQRAFGTVGTVEPSATPAANDPRAMPKTEEPTK
jgi:hypothetical protein